MSKKNVLVVGGGPAGSTAAALLARAGMSVQLVERDTFPRYHIGESIAPSCRAVMALSGVLDKVQERGYPVKRGVLLRWGNEEDWKVDWPELFGPDVSSWQVDRSDFDDVLLAHAAEEGAEVAQGAKVKRILFDGDRAVGAEWVDAGGTARTIEFDHLVDASGRAGILSGQTFKSREPHEVFRNVAIWGYWTGAKLLPGTPENGIDVISAPNGWYWVIPLRDDRYSIGFVSHQSDFLEKRPQYASIEDMLMGAVAASPTVKQLVEGAVYQGEAHVEQDFSYVSERFCGPGYYLAGDAACFLDPLLSTGVHLAMYSGMLSATCIVATSNGEITEAEAGGFYESLYRNAYSRLYAVVAGVYQQYLGQASYFELAQGLVREEEDHYDAPNGAFGEITAGMADLRDAGRAGGTAPMQELIEAVAEARRRVTDTSGEMPAGPPIDAIKMNPMDLYDSASGLYIVTEPRLGIRRAEVEATTGS
ncbi:NAD(P)/FAD-dependent oxidoreductase [Amycolatopsis sp. NPDC004747]